MSDSQAYEAVQIASDGVTVTKRFEADEFPVPAIAFNFESRRSEPVTVRLSDVVPDDVAVEDLGFHPEYGSEYWTIDDDEISFERDRARRRVHDGVRHPRDWDGQRRAVPHRAAIRRGRPAARGRRGAIVGDSSDALKDVISGDADSVPGLDDVDDDDIETLDLKDPNNEGTPQSAESGDDDSGSAAEGGRRRRDGRGDRCRTLRRQPRGGTGQRTTESERDEGRRPASSARPSTWPATTTAASRRASRSSSRTSPTSSPTPMPWRSSSTRTGRATR